MSTREKILVGLMIVAVCVGTLILLSDGPKETASDADSGGQPPLTQMLTRLTAQYGGGPSLESHRYALSMAQTPWQKDLFSKGSDLLPASAGTPDAADVLPANVALVYSGYIETPYRRVAIINGIEYVVGDQLDQSAYKIQHIEPTQVILTSPQQRTVSLSLVESWDVGKP